MAFGEPEGIMNCRTCKYRLFGIKARQCPECGAAFKPSEFVFVPMSVVFGCPHCVAVHEGNGPDGLPMPRELTCGCGEVVAVDDMTAMPAPGVTDEETRVVQNPWLEWWGEGGRRGNGRSAVGAWWATSKMMALSPARLMRSTPDDAPTFPAMRFATINFVMVNGGLGALIAILLAFTFGGLGGDWLREVIVGLFLFALLLWISVLCSLAGLMLYALLAHELVHGLQRDPGGFGRTLQCFAYSTGPMAVMVWPCFVFPPFVVIFPIWCVLCTIIALQEAQQVTAGEATTAVIAPVGAAAFTLFLLALLENWL
jgi:hypothetical protein